MAVIGYLSVPKIDVLFPATVHQAVEMLQSNPDAEILAAGTDIITSLTLGEKKTRKFIDISRIEDLKEKNVSKNEARVGALSTHFELATMFGDKIPAFSTFYTKYSSPSAAYRVTVGGSLMLKRSSEDLIPILLTLDAVVNFQTKDGEKSIPLHDFVSKPLSDKGVLTSVSFKLNPQCFFDKLCLGVSRYPLASVAVSIDDSSVFRVAVSHKDVETPGRVFAVEKFLSGRKINSDTTERAAELLSKSINPADDVFASGWYRRRLVGVLFKRLLLKLGGES